MNKIPIVFRRLGIAMYLVKTMKNSCKAISLPWWSPVPLITTVMMAVVLHNKTTLMMMLGPKIGMIPPLWHQQLFLLVMVYFIYMLGFLINAVSACTLW